MIIGWLQGDMQKNTKTTKKYAWTFCATWRKGWKGSHADRRKFLHWGYGRNCLLSVTVGFGPQCSKNFNVYIGRKQIRFFSRKDGKIRETTLQNVV